MIPSASAAIAFDVLGRALLSFLPLSIGELCVIGEGLIILADLAIGMVYKAIYQPAGA